MKKYGTFVTDNKYFVFQQENKPFNRWCSMERPKAMIYPDVGPAGISFRNTQRGIDKWNIQFPDCQMIRQYFPNLDKTISHIMVSLSKYEDEDEDFNYSPHVHQYGLFHLIPLLRVWQINDYDKKPNLLCDLSTTSIVTEKDDHPTKIVFRNEFELPNITL